MSATTTTAALGASRDRTNLFISYRQSYTHHPSKRTRLAGPSTAAPYSDHDDSERAGLMASAADPPSTVIEMDLLPPRWLDIQDQIATQLTTITATMRTLDTLHAKHVLPGFDDDSVKAREARDIETQTQSITRGLATCQRAVQRIATLLPQQPSQADETMARNLQIDLASRVASASSAFRKKQSAYLKKLRAQGGMPDLPSTSTSTSTNNRSTPPHPSTQNPYTNPALSDAATDTETAHSTLTTQTQQTATLRRQGLSESTIAARESEIARIAQGVIDLSAIFTELNALVIDQGSLLDRIDYNVERTAEHMKAADGDLRVGEGYQRKGTRRKVMLLLVLLVVGMFVLLLVKPKGRGGEPASAPAPKPAPAPEHGVGAGAPKEPDAGLPPARRDGGGLEEVFGESGDGWKIRRRRRRRRKVDGREDGEHVT